MQPRPKDTDRSSREASKRRLAVTCQRDLVVASLLCRPDSGAVDGGRRKRSS